MHLNPFIRWLRSTHTMPETVCKKCGSDLREGDQILIEGLVLPPFASSGPYYSGFSDYHLPFDNSYIGSAHSHPSGSNRPSLEDLNRGFYGAVSIIIAHPYEDETVAAYDRDGNRLEIKIINTV